MHVDLPWVLQTSVMMDNKYGISILYLMISLIELAMPLVANFLHIHSASYSHWLATAAQVFVCQQ